MPVAPILVNRSAPSGYKESIEEIMKCDHTEEITQMVKDIEVIKGWIVGNGTLGLGDRVTNLENANKGVVRMFATGILSGIISISIGFLAFKLYGG